MNDPPKMVHRSTTMRERVWDWYTSTFYTRLSRGGGVLLIATRWHLDDLTGRLMVERPSKNGASFNTAYSQFKKEISDKRREDFLKDMEKSKEEKSEETKN